MRVASVSQRNVAVRAIALTSIWCALAVRPVCAQYIHFMVVDVERNTWRDIGSAEFEKQKGNIVLCGYQGDAQWLVAQQDDRSHLHTLPKLAVLDLVQHEITREELQYVASLGGVENLSIGIAPEGVRVPADALNALKKKKGLRFLNLCIHDLSNAHLAFLAQCNAVAELRIEVASEHQWNHKNDLNRPKGLGELTDSSAEYIAALKSLEVLDVRLNNSLSDQFIAPLSKLPKLREFTIDSPLLTNEALRIVAQELQLKRLSISSPKLTDEGVAKWLIHAKSLRHLEIKSPELTQKSVDALKGMDLKTLTVNDRHVIREQVIDSTEQPKGPDTE